jgi:hypothetical protein
MASTVAAPEREVDAPAPDLQWASNAALTGALAGAVGLGGATAGAGMVLSFGAAAGNRAISRLVGGPAPDPDALMSPEEEAESDPDALMDPESDRDALMSPDDPPADPDALMPPDGDVAPDPDALMRPDGDVAPDPDALMRPDGDVAPDPDALMPPDGGAAAPPPTAAGTGSAPPPADGGTGTASPPADGGTGTASPPEVDAITGAAPIAGPPTAAAPAEPTAAAGPSGGAPATGPTTTAARTVAAPTGGPAPGGSAAPSARPRAAAAGTRAPAAPAHPSPPARIVDSVASLDAAAAESRAKLQQLTIDLANRLSESARTQRDRVIQTTEDQATRVDLAFGQAIQDIQDYLQINYDQVVADRDAAIAAAGQNHERTTGAVIIASNEKQRLLMSTGRAQAEAAEAKGAAEAARASGDARKLGATALQVGRQKAEYWRPQERGPRIARETGEMAAEAAKQMVEAGDQAAAQAHQDAASIAGKIRQEAVDGMLNMIGGLEKPRQRVDQIHTDAVAGINALADSTLTALVSQSDALCGQLLVQRAGAVASIRDQGNQAIAVIDQAEADASAALELSGAQVVDSLDQAVGAMWIELDSVSPSRAARVAPAAAAQLRATVDGYASDSDGRIGDLEQLIGTAADGVVTSLTSAADQLANGTSESALQFGTAAMGLAKANTKSTSDRAGEAAGGMNDVVTGYEAQLQKAIDDSTRSWMDSVNQGGKEITGKVDKALAGVRDTGNALPGKIDERAHDIQDESWLSRAFSFVGGFLGGILSGLWGLVKVVLIVALVVIAIVVVAVVIGAIIGGLAGVLAVIGVLATIASVIGAILPFAMAFGLGFMIVMDLFKLVEAARRDDLSDSERGHLFGEVTFDVATVVFGEELAKPVQWLGETLRGGKSVEEARAVDEVAEALRSGEGAGEAGAGESTAARTAEPSGEPRPADELADVTAVENPDPNQVYRMPEHTVMQSADATNAGEAFDMFHNSRAQDPTREVAVYRNTQTGEYMIVQGEPETVAVAAGEVPLPGGYAQRWKEVLNSGSDVGLWELQAHSHPIDPATGLTPYRGMYASGPDMGAMYSESLMTGQARSSSINFVSAQGEAQTNFGYTPLHDQPFWIDMPNGFGGRQELRFENIQKYYEFMEMSMGHPAGPIPEVFFKYPDPTRAAAGLAPPAMPAALGEVTAGEGLASEALASEAKLGGGGSEPPVSGGESGPVTPEEEPTFSADGPMVQIPASTSGDPARVAEAGAGPQDTNLGLPPEQGSPVAPDSNLIDLTRSDLQPRDGVVEWNANEPPPPTLRNQDALIINNPRGYTPNIEVVGQAVRPGGRIIIQGRAEVVPGMRPANPDMTRILKLVQRGEVPPGYRVVEVVTDPAVPVGDPATVARPPDALGGPFNRTDGGPVSWPNTRIVIEKLPTGGTSGPAGAQ